MSGATIFCTILLLINTMMMDVPLIAKIFHLFLVISTWLITGVIMGPILIILGFLFKAWILCGVGVLIFLFKE